MWKGEGKRLTILSRERIQNEESSEAKQRISLGVFKICLSERGQENYKKHFSLGCSFPSTVNHSRCHWATVNFLLYLNVCSLQS